MTHAVAPASFPAVLVVEDDSLIAMMMADALAEAGYRPVCSLDGTAAAPFAAAVVDLRLADGLDDCDVIRHLRDQCAVLPVVVITGFHPAAPQADLRGTVGPKLRLLKPCDCDPLSDGVATMLRASTATGEPIQRHSISNGLPATV